MKKVSVKNKILFGLVLILLMTGCGLKANPVSPTSAVFQNQGEQKLTVSNDGNAVVLTWQIQNPDRKISHMNVEKSQLGTAGNICKDCPRTFEVIGQLQVLNVKNGKNEYRFTDSLVEKGKIYSYRLKLCNEAGVCRESQTVEIDFK
ncbi:MAG: hypothetical protein Q8O28_05340 [Smithellaceae bacterium]|nr:hypothetical protein [Smithellaceae bacterium]